MLSWLHLSAISTTTAIEIKLLANLHPDHLKHFSCKLTCSTKVKNSVDPDQMASLEAIWSGSTVVSRQDKSWLSRRRVKLTPDTGADPWFLERGDHKDVGVRIADVISFFQNIPWKWNNLVSLRPYYFIFVGFLKREAGGGGGSSGVKGEPFERTPLTSSGSATATFLIPQVSAAWLAFQQDFADTLPTPIEIYTA